MKSFRDAQLQLYAELKQGIGCPFFLKKCRKGPYLWVSDIPRRREQWEADVLLKENYLFHTAEELLYIGFSAGKWMEQTAGIRCSVPPFPTDSEQLEAYALIRLLLSHGGDDWDLDLLAACYRLTACNRPEVPAMAGELLRYSAEKLRCGGLHCQSGGKLLCEWYFRIYH